MGRQTPSWFSTGASQQDTLAAVSLCVDGIFLVDLLMFPCCTSYSVQKCSELALPMLVFG